MITPTELRAHIETDLTDLELQTVIESEAEWLAKIAPTGTVTEEFMFETRTNRLHLKRPAESITQIREGIDEFNYSILASSEYRITADGNPQKKGDFDFAVEVTYVVSEATTLRDSVLIDLAKLRLLYQSGLSTSAGDFGTIGATQKMDLERARITSRLQMRRFA